VNNHESADNSKIEMTGDWEWKSEINVGKSGWQSDQFNSLLRFRLPLGSIPFVSVTYMRSFSTFGNLRLVFQVVKAEDEDPIEDIFEKDLPWLQLSGRRQEYSLWETLSFSPDKKDDAASRGAFEMFNHTVLGHEDVRFVDLYNTIPMKSVIRESRSRP
jgi:hypothetical protein